MSATANRMMVSRRRLIGLAGAAGATFLVGSGRHGPAWKALGSPEVADTLSAPDAEAAACVLTPSKTEGPYFVDERLNRSDIRAGQSGVPLTLTFDVYDQDNDCAAVKGAVVDVWHCNASGLYSDESANGTRGQTWLRGLQATNPSGAARFTTIYPSWYSGRTIHIHFKIRFFNGSAETYEFSSQLFFPESVNAAVLARSPYNARSGRDTTNAQDGIYGSNGAQLTLAPSGSAASGYAATFSVGLSGLPSGATSGGETSSDSKVSGSLRAMRFHRTKHGTRYLKLRLHLDEAVAVDARILRGKRTIARRRYTNLKKGTRRPRVTIGRHVHGGKARLKLTIKDKHGNTKVIRRKLRVPRRHRAHRH